MTVLHWMKIVHFSKLHVVLLIIIAVYKYPVNASCYGF